MAESAYARAMRVERASDRKKERNKGARRVSNKNGFCDATRTHGGKCKMAAGFGTDHLGYGRCKYHGGNSPSHKLKAAKAEAVFMGAPKNITPVEAIIWIIHITAGEVEWFTEQMQKLDQSEWYENAVLGKQMNILQRARAESMTRLEKYSKDALTLGLMERRVRLAEMYGQALARYTKGIIDDLMLTSEQMERVPKIVRKHLALLEGGQPKLDLPAELMESAA